MQNNTSPPHNLPILSIGLPVYNGAKWIVDAIESFLEQGFGNFELIICDNCSTDETEKLCREFAKRDSRVRYHRNASNIGLYKNFDRAFELSKGKYFKWAADSDFCLEGFFEKCVNVLEQRHDVVLVYTRAFLLLQDQNEEMVTQEYFDDFNIEDDSPSERFIKYLNREKINNIMHGVIRSAAIRKTSLHRPMAGSDISMVAELSLLGKFVEVPDRLFVRRFDQETSTLLMDRRTATMKGVKLGASIPDKIKLHALRFLSVYKAPIALDEKLRIWAYLLRRAVASLFECAGNVMRFIIFTPVKLVLRR